MGCVVQSAPASARHGGRAFGDRDRVAFYDRLDADLVKRVRWNPLRAVRLDRGDVMGGGPAIDTSNQDWDASGCSTGSGLVPKIASIRSASSVSGRAWR